MEPIPRMDEGQLAWYAGVIDLAGVIRTREVGDTVLPMLALHGPNTLLLQQFAEATATKVTIVKRDYHRMNCSVHCTEAHQHVLSESGRWSVSGAKATVVLFALRPYLRIQGYAADECIEVGMSAPRKATTGFKMEELGWPLPEEWPSTRSLTVAHGPVTSETGRSVVTSLFTGRSPV